jgi:hypothetical protein
MIEVQSLTLLLFNFLILISSICSFNVQSGYNRIRTMSFKINSWSGDKFPIPNPNRSSQKMDAAWGRGKFR